MTISQVTIKWLVHLFSIRVVSRSVKHPLKILCTIEVYHKSATSVAVNCPYGEQACYSLIVVWFVTNALCFEITHHLVKLAFPEPLEPVRIAKELDQ